MASVLEQLNAIRSKAGERRTVGLDDQTVCQLVTNDPGLAKAVDMATEEFEALNREFPELMALGEVEQVEAIEEHIVNFYADDTVNPYVSMAAYGPWIVTTKGAVLHDDGGYGMLGFGHLPEPIIEAMTIAAFAVGAEHGWIYVRGEYPRATRRLEAAIGQARSAGASVD